MFPKVATRYFTFLGVIFNYHMESIVKVDTRTFVLLIEALREGLAVAVNSTLVSLCAQAVDHLAPRDPRWTGPCGGHLLGRLAVFCRCRLIDRTLRT